ncbi:MAG: hypothetical protein ACREPN_06850 [Rudaea sp.]
MPLRALFAALVLGVFGSQARAADLVGYGEAFNVLYSVDLTTSTATQIGGAGTINGQSIANIEGLGFSPAGVLYAVSDAGSSKVLLTIDKSTGLASVVGNLNLGTTNQLDLGLAFTCDGKLWMSASTGQFWQVDPATAAVTALGNLGVKITGLAARGTKLYGTGSQGNNNLYSIDPIHTTATLIGSYQSVDYITTTSPGFDPSGQLWAILDYVPPQPGNTAVAQWSDLAQLAPATGALTKLGAITASSPTSAPNLAYIGIKGLAIPASVCAATANSAAVPILSWRVLAILFALVLLLGGTRLRRHRPNL